MLGAWTKVPTVLHHGVIMQVQWNSEPLIHAHSVMAVATVLSLVVLVHKDKCVSMKS